MPVSLPPALAAHRLLTQREAAMLLAVSVRYLRESSCPKVLLPGHGKKGQPVVRYALEEVLEWQQQWRTRRRLTGSVPPNVERAS